MTLYTTSGSPWENGCRDSFNGSLWDELLNGELFYSLTVAKALIGVWRRHDNLRVAADRQAATLRTASSKPSIDLLDTKPTLIDAPNQPAASGAALAGWAAQVFRRWMAAGRHLSGPDAIAKTALRARPVPCVAAIVWTA